MIRIISMMGSACVATWAILHAGHVYGRAVAFAWLMIIVLVIALACSLSNRSER